MTNEGDRRRAKASRLAHLRAEQVFLVLGSVFGLLFAIWTPPFDTPDELRHFGRVYLISEGRLGVPGFAPGHGSTLPEDLRSLHPLRTTTACRHSLGDLADQYAEPRRPEPRRSATRITTQFPPLVYAPQALGVALGRLFDVPAIGLLHLARLFDLATWLVLGAWAIRNAGAWRWAITAIALLPTSIFLAASVTADATTAAIALVFFAAIVRRAASDAPALALRDRAVLLGAALALGLTKPGYGLLALGVGLIPAARLGGRAARAKLVAGALAIANVPALAWTLYAQSVNPAPLGPAADPIAQALGILGDPVGFAGVLASTLLHEALPWLAGFVGLLGPANVPLPLWMYAAYPGLLGVACSLDGPPEEARPAFPRWAGPALAVTTAMGLVVLGYLAWNPVGASHVADIHGRYFLPLAPFVALAIPRMRLPLVRARWLFACASAIGLTIAFARLYQRYYT